MACHEIDPAVVSALDDLDLSLDLPPATTEPPVHVARAPGVDRIPLLGADFRRRSTGDQLECDPERIADSLDDPKGWVRATVLEVSDIAA